MMVIKTKSGLGECSTPRHTTMESHNSYECMYC